MEATLLQVYAPRDPLAEVLRGEITLRKFRVMVEGAREVPGTPYWRALNGPWEDRERLLHTIASVLINLDTNYFNTHRAKEVPAREAQRLWAPDLTWYQEQARKEKNQPDERQVESEAWLVHVLNRREV